jgi:hypothetical protein
VRWGNRCGGLGVGGNRAGDLDRLGFDRLDRSDEAIAPFADGLDDPRCRRVVVEDLAQLADATSQNIIADTGR